MEVRKSLVRCRGSVCATQCVSSRFGAEREHSHCHIALEPTPSIRAKYDKSFQLSYVVKLSESQLSTELHVTNTSETELLEFQALFHNYIRCPSDDALIFPLQCQEYYDKTASTEEEKNTRKTETRAGVDVKTYTDSIYSDAPQRYQVKWPNGGVEIKVTALKDLVVWNPQEEVGSKLADMEDGGWQVHEYLNSDNYHVLTPIFC